MIGEKLIIKMWDSLVDMGIAGLQKPWQTRRLGHAAIAVRRDELLVLAQAEQDAAAIRRGDVKLSADGDGLWPAATVLLEAADSNSRAARLVEFENISNRSARAEGIRQEVAIAKAVLKAEEELANDETPPSDDAVDDDWILRWRDCVSGVASEDLQRIWGKVLAGEVKSPGTFSLRTLEFMRNLSRSEAKLIERLAAFVIRDVIYRPHSETPGWEHWESVWGIKFDELLALQDLGVLTGF